MIGIDIEAVEIVRFVRGSRSKIPYRRSLPSGRVVVLHRLDIFVVCPLMTQPTTSALHTSNITSLPLLARGKVRDNYAVGDDRILMVAIGPPVGL